MKALWTKKVSGKNRESTGGIRAYKENLMTDTELKERKTDGEMGIRIDYENIDVADIMDQIKKKIASQPKKEPVQPALQSEYVPYAGAHPELPPEPRGARTKIKALLLKMMKPFSPLIKLLVLPVSHELAETVKTLDLTRRKLNYLSEKLDYDLSQLHTLMDSKLDRVDKTVNKRMNHAFDDIGRIKEYTKLLHSLSHNLVVELTKLKIEEETIKVKARILEKDFEFLGKRERALEEKVFK